jgi:hypothetical protein
VGKTHRRANAAGIGWCRGNSGARAPLAREGLRLVWVCPCVVSRLQKSASVAEAQRSAYPVATGRVDGSQGRDRPRKGQEPVAKASILAPCPFDEPQGKSTVRRWLGGAPHGVLTHAAGASLGVRTVCHLRDTLGQRDKRGSAAGATRSCVTRRKAFRPSRVSFRKGRSARRSRSRGSNPEMLAPQGVGIRTSCDAGTLGSGSVVPVLATRNVRRRRRARQRLLQPTRRGRSVTRGAARRRPSRANAKVFWSMREQGPQSGESCASRPKLARAKTRPFLPKLELREQIGPGRNAHSVPKDA